MTEEEARLKLEDLRVLIDELDRRIVGLLNDRTRVVEDIGRIKRQARLPIYEPKREDQVFANVTESNAGPVDAGRPAPGFRAHHRRDAHHPAVAHGIGRRRSQ